MEFALGMRSTNSANSRIWRDWLWTRTWSKKFTTSPAGKICTGSPSRTTPLILTIQSISSTSSPKWGSWDSVPVQLWRKLVIARRNSLLHELNSWRNWMVCLTMRMRDVTVNFSTSSRPSKTSWQSTSSKSWKSLKIPVCSSSWTKSILVGSLSSRNSEVLSKPWAFRKKARISRTVPHKSSSSPTLRRHKARCWKRSCCWRWQSPHWRQSAANCSKLRCSRWSCTTKRMAMMTIICLMRTRDNSHSSVLRMVVAS